MKFNHSKLDILIIFERQIQIQIKMNKPKLCYRYIDRLEKNSTEKAISELGKLKQFDMSIATTENIIGGHRFVLSMFSKYFREVVSTAPPHTVIFTRKF